MYIVHCTYMYMYMYVHVYMYMCMCFDLVTAYAEMAASTHIYIYIYMYIVHTSLINTAILWHVYMQCVMGLNPTSIIQSPCSE